MRGRIRTFKPEVFDDEELWDLGEQTGLPVFQCFLGLWSYADREGRFEWRPRALKKHILPYWDGDISAVLEALASKSFIVRYTVAGKDYGYVRTLKEHQSFNSREPVSVLPPPSEHARSDTHMRARAESDTDDDPGSCAHRGNGTEWEGKGMGVGAARARACARTDATAFHRERTDPPSGSRPARTYTMPGPEPPEEYIQEALMGAVPREQAVSTWEHYVGAGLPERGVERLYPWLIKRAKERAVAVTKLGTRIRGPDDVLQRQAERVQMLREQEAEEERRKAAGGSG